MASDADVLPATPTEAEGSDGSDGTGANVTASEAKASGVAAIDSAGPGETTRTGSSGADAATGSSGQCRGGEGQRERRPAEHQPCAARGGIAARIEQPQHARRQLRRHQRSRHVSDAVRRIR